MKFFNWIINIFKKKESPKTEAPKPIESKPIEPTPVPEPRKKLNIAIVRGHGGGDSGAVGCDTTEVEYNTWVMKEIEKLNLPNVKCFYGESSANAVMKSLTSFPDLTMQLHLNSATPQAKGCEVLVLKNDIKSFPFAKKFAKDFCDKFNRVMRGEEGLKKLDSSDRGFTSLKLSTFGAKILCEPWFISNKDEYVSKEEYLEFLIKYIEEVG